MTDDNGDDVQPKFTMSERTFGDIAKCGQTDLPSQLHKDIWNRAMDKAIEACNKYESYGAAYEIKTLKV